MNLGALFPNLDGASPAPAPPPPVNTVGGFGAGWWIWILIIIVVFWFLRGGYLRYPGYGGYGRCCGLPGRGIF